MGEQAQKAMTLRIGDEQYAALAWIARLNGTSLVAEVRDAIAEYIKARRRDPEFQVRLRLHRAEQEAIYEGLTVRGELSQDSP